MVVAILLRDGAFAGMKKKGKIFSLVGLPQNIRTYAYVGIL